VSVGVGGNLELEDVFVGGKELEVDDIAYLALVHRQNDVARPDPGAVTGTARINCIDDTTARRPSAADLASLGLVLVELDAG
jgi:hypothetical protein